MVELLENKGPMTGWIVSCCNMKLKNEAAARPILFLSLSFCSLTHSSKMPSLLQVAIMHVGSSSTDFYRSTQGTHCTSVALYAPSQLYKCTIEIEFHRENPYRICWDLRPLPYASLTTNTRVRTHTHTHMRLTFHPKVTVTHTSCRNFQADNSQSYFFHNFAVVKEMQCETRRI